MRVIRLIVPILLFSQALSAQVPYGVPVVSVAIQPEAPAVVDTVGIRPGDRLTPELLHDAIQSLYDAGGYGRIEVEAFPENDGTRIEFTVEPPYFFATIRLEPERILQRPVSSYATLPYGQRFSRTQLDRIVEVVRAELEAEGYFAASPAPMLDFDEATRLVQTTIVVSPGPRARVRNVTFRGQQTFSPEELRRALDIRSGELFRGSRVNEGLGAVETLFAELGFVNTRAEVESRVYDPEANTVDLEVGIEPGLFLLVGIDGFDLSDEQIEELTPFYEERAVDEDLVEEGRVALTEFLRREGYLQARVAARFARAPFDPAYQVDYVVDAGERFSIREVRIDGNTFFSDAVLHDRIGISPEGFLKRGVYSPELLDDAAETIRRLYQASGFVDTRVTPVARSENGQITVVITIDEGRGLTIGEVGFEGAVQFDPQEVASWTDVAPGQLYTQNRVLAGRRSLTSAYHSRGYDQVRVETAAEPVGSDRVNVVYRISEGEPSRIRQVLVAGNTLTREKIVHRNSGLEAGRPYDPEAILEAQRRLYATGLFNRVDIVPLDRRRSDERDLLIQLEDAGPIVLTYGVGAQDREGVRGTVEVTHSNLWGLDRSISARIRGSRREQRFQTTYREPRLFNWELDGFASLFVERARLPAFDADKVDFSVQSLKRFANTDSLLMSASYQTVNLRDIRDNRRTEEFPDEEGIIQIARLGSSYIRDTRNDILNPSRGNYFTGTFQLANTALGSEINFASLFTQFSMYRPAREAVLAASVRFGWNQPYGRTASLPITERYFAGGSTTLRGFDLDDAGPRAGGNALTIVNTEYRFPIPFPVSGFGGTLFYDTGTVFERISDFSFGDFTHTAGIGIRYQTPLGPIRVDFGLNVNRQPGESANQVFFTLGHAF